LKKIASFTIIELMITLLISSIVMMIAYYALFLVHRQFERYRARSGEIRAYHLLATAWQRDFDRAQRVRDSLEDGGEQILFTHGDTLIRYSLHGGILVRVFRDLPDSFPLGVTLNSIRYLDDTLRLITTIRLNTLVDGQPVLVTGEKRYSCGEIMDAERLQEQPITP
jgi:prepilin-type N-terminal cleavage/methylation domain-containing protein